MLTIFEYLRKRAFESVVAGVQDAVQAIEPNPPKGSSSPSSTELKSTSSENSPLRISDVEPVAAEFDPQKFLSGPVSNSVPHAGPDTPTVPPPRRRGRPRRQDRQP